MKIRFWGVRGSIPSPSPQTVKYGGNTSCVELEVNGKLLIFDAGTGIRPLGNHLREVHQNDTISGYILIGHTHWDHIQGFPFFLPLYMKDNHFYIYGPSGTSKNLHAKLDGQMSWDYFPVSLKDLGSNLEFVDVASDKFSFSGINIDTIPLNHPGGAIGYRVSNDKNSMVYTSDFEPYSDSAELLKTEEDISNGLIEEEKRFIAFLEEADVWIADGQYIISEYMSRTGWGHSPIQYPLELADKAKVKHLVLSHHDPNHTDEFLDAMNLFAQEHVRQKGYGFTVSLAKEGMEIEI